MVRKKLLASIAGQRVSSGAHEARADYALPKASPSKVQSIDELAENAKRIVTEETIVDLDTELEIRPWSKTALMMKHSRYFARASRRLSESTVPESSRVRTLHHRLCALSCPGCE